jgi:hypothetical protein
MHLRSLGRVLVGSVAVLSLFWAAGAAAKPKPKAEDLAPIYVLYTEPPFAHQKGEKIRVPLFTLWDREKKERAIREEVHRQGAEGVLLERSYMEYDGVASSVGQPGPRGVTPMIKVPTRTAFVEGHLVRRTDSAPVGDCERPFAVGFDDAWNAARRAIAALGWKVKAEDTDSRYLTVELANVAPEAMACDSGEPAQASVGRVWVRSCGKASVVRLDVEASPCRSLGTVEKQFFGDLERRLGS